jgi:hypothetical protein
MTDEEKCMQPVIEATEDKSTEKEREVLESPTGKQVDKVHDKCIVCSFYENCDADCVEMCEAYRDGTDSPDKTPETIKMHPSKDKCTICFGHGAMMETCLHCGGTGKEPEVEEEICETCGFKKHCNQLNKDNNRNCLNYVQAEQK